jgi:hypothetical protein
MPSHPCSLKTVAAAFAIVAVFSAGAKGSQPFTPDVPRTWSNEAVAGFELPLATPEYSQPRLQRNRWLHYLSFQTTDPAEE